MTSRLLHVSSPRRWLSQNTQVWSRPVIVAGVLLASACLSPLAAQHHLLLLLLVGASVAVILLRWPPLGLIGLIIAAFFVPFTISTGTKASFNAPMLVTMALLGLWAVDLLHARRFPLVLSRANRPLMCFLIVWGLAFLSGNAFWDYRVTVISTANVVYIQLGQIVLFVFSAGVFLLAENLLTDVRWLRRVTYAFVVISILKVLVQLSPGMPGAIRSLWVPGALGGLYNTWIVALLYGQLLFDRTLGWGTRLLYVLFLVVLGYFSWVLGSSWATGWLPPAIAIFTISWLRSRRLGMFVTLVAVVTLLTQWSFFFDEFVPAELARGTIYRPRVAMEVTKLAASANWLLGLGPVNYRYYYQTYYPIAVFGNWVAILPEINSHNNFVDIFAQTGLLGSGVFVWFLVAVGRTGWQVRQRLRGEAGFVESYANGALGAFVGVVVACMMADWFLPFVYNIGFSGFRHTFYSWLFFGGLVALERFTRRAQTTDVSTPELEPTLAPGRQPC